MIIVKTKNGDQFVNDKEMKVAAHDRSARTVKLWGIDMKSPLMTFEEVESVNYFSDAQPTSYCDSGNESKELRLLLDWSETSCARWRNYATYNRDFTFNLRSFVERIKNSLGKFDRSEAQRVLDEIDKDKEKLAEENKPLSELIDQLKAEIKKLKS